MDALWEAFKKMRQEQGVQAAEAFYRHEVWPALLARWRASPPVPASLPEVAVSVHTLGTSPEATMLAMLGTKAKEVYVLHTAESRQYLRRIEEELGISLVAIEVPKNDPSELYREVGRILARHGGATLAFDLTSGTKAMTAGLAAAAFFAQDIGLPVVPVYIDNDAYDAELRRPRAGSERLIVLSNPHAVLGDLGFKTAKALYDGQDYAQAERAFAQLAERTGDHRRFTPYARLASAYAAWYSNRFADAAAAFRALFDELDKPAYVAHPLHQHLPALRQQAKGVTLLRDLADAYSDKAKRLSALADSERVLWLLATLWAMQERFAAGEDYTAAALLCYRGLEVASQHRLARRGFDSLAADYGVLGLSREELGQRYRDAWERVSTKAQADRERGLPPDGEPVPLLEGYLLLSALDDDLTRRPTHRTLMGLTELRNQSLWIHGYRPVTREEHRRLQGLFKEVINALEALEGGHGGHSAWAVPI